MSVCIEHKYVNGICGKCGCLDRRTETERLIGVQTERLLRESRRESELTRLRVENEFYKKGHESDCKALAELEVENEELRKALEPFANYWIAWSDKKIKDTQPVGEYNRHGFLVTSFPLTHGDCRRAAELLNRKTP